MKFPLWAGALLIAATAPTAECQPSSPEVPPAPQQASVAESDDIRAAALSYIEAWYDGDAERMERALHPDLAKRIIPPGADGKAGPIRHMAASDLIKITRTRGGGRTPPAQRRADMLILDIFANVASARVDAADWIDYLHLVRVDAGWKIVNVLWEFRPAESRTPPGR